MDGGVAFKMRTTNIRGPKKEKNEFLMDSALGEETHYGVWAQKMGDKGILNVERGTQSKMEL
jgi:hypothetical protein